MRENGFGRKFVLVKDLHSLQKYTSKFLCFELAILFLCHFIGEVSGVLSWMHAADNITVTPRKYRGV